MILKSLARKKPNFRQLYTYLTHRADENFRILHNVQYSQEAEEIIRQFEENAELLAERKGGNYLYHEILSLKLYPELSLEQVKEVLFEVSQLYLQERARDNLCYGRLHIEHHHAHVHLMISSNELGNEQRLRLEKQRFLEIQKNLERYILERYPELQQEQVYTKERERIKEHVQDREFQLRQRTGKATQREKVKELLSYLFDYAQSQEEFLEYCTKYQVRFYQRGKHTGIELEGRKYRLQKLELEESYKAFIKKCERIKELEEVRSREQHSEYRQEPEKEYKKQANTQEEQPDYVKKRLEELEHIKQQQELLKQKELELQKELEKLHRETEPKDLIAKRLQELDNIDKQKGEHERDFEMEV